MRAGNSDKSLRCGLSTSLAQMDGLGEGSEERMHCMEKWVCASVSLRWRMSPRRPKCLSKSAPRIGFLTSAMTKIQGSKRLRPRLSVRERFL